MIQSETVRGRCGFSSSPQSQDSQEPLDASLPWPLRDALDFDAFDWGEGRDPVSRVDVRDDVLGFVHGITVCLVSVQTDEVLRVICVQVDGDCGWRAMARGREVLDFELLAELNGFQMGSPQPSPAWAGETEPATTTELEKTINRAPINPW